MNAASATPAPTAPPGRHSGGSTLIEVLVAVLLLTLVAVAGGAYVYHSRALVAIQRNRLIALELASSRMERLRSSRPAAIEPPGPGPHYLVPAGDGGWALSTADPGETVVLNHRSFPLQTVVEWQPLVDGALSNNILRLTVTAAYRPEAGELVTLSSRYAP